MVENLPVCLRNGLPAILAISDRFFMDIIESQFVNNDRLFEHEPLDIFVARRLSIRARIAEPVIKHAFGLE